MSGFVTSGFSAGGGEGAVGAIKMAIVGGTLDNYFSIFERLDFGVVLLQVQD